MAKRKKKGNRSEALAQIEVLQRQIQALVQQFKEDGEHEKAPPPREPLDAALIGRIRTMVQERPMFFAEIVSAIDENEFGIKPDKKENKIKAVLTDMQRKQELLINIGKANRALWYYFPPAVAARVIADLMDLGVRGDRNERSDPEPQRA